MIVFARKSVFLFASFAIPKIKMLIGSEAASDFCFFSRSIGEYIESAIFCEPW